MSWEELTKGLIGVSAVLGILIVATKPLAAQAKGMIAAGFAIGIMAVGITILAGAVKIFATMSWEELAKGLLGVALGLGLIVATTHLLPKDLAGKDGIHSSYFPCFGGSSDCRSNVWAYEFGNTW
jgi:type III secretory pathway component EscU